MKAIYVLIIGLLSLIPFFFHALTITPMGTDAVYFYLFSCQAPNIPTNIEIPFLSKLFFESLPCDLLSFKFVSSLFLFVSALVVAKIGELFDKEYGWLAGVFVFISTAWLNFHIQIEDDILGFPLLFMATYFFLIGQMENKGNKWKAISIALVLFTGAFVWKGALLYLVAFSFFWVPALITLFGVFFIIGFGSLDQLVGKNMVAENMNVLLYTLFGTGTLGLGHGMGLVGLYFYRQRQWLFVPFLVGLLLNLKWAIHLAPFLGVGMMLIVRDFDLKIKSGKLKFEGWVNKYFVWIFVGMALVSITAQSAGLLLQAPYPAQIEAVQFAIEKSGDATMANDWSYGYWIMFFGGRTEIYGGGWTDYYLQDHEKPEGILLTENPVPLKECRLLKEWAKGGFYKNSIQVYDCAQ